MARTSAVTRLKSRLKKTPRLQLLSMFTLAKIALIPPVIIEEVTFFGTPSPPRKPRMEISLTEQLKEMTTNGSATPYLLETVKLEALFGEKSPKNESPLTKKPCGRVALVPARPIKVAITTLKAEMAPLYVSLTRS